MPSSSTFFQPCYISSFYRPLLHNARGNVRFYLVVWLFSKRPLSISLGINCLCMHYTNTKVCRSLLSWNHARNPIEDDLHYRVFKTILSQKEKKWSNVHGHRNTTMIESGLDMGIPNMLKSVFGWIQSLVFRCDEVSLVGVHGVGRLGLLGGALQGRRGRGRVEQRILPVKCQIGGLLTGKSIVNLSK